AFRGETEAALGFAKSAFEAAPNDGYMAGVGKGTGGYALSSAGRGEEGGPDTMEGLGLLAQTPSLPVLARGQQWEPRRVQGRPAEALHDLSSILAGEGSFVAHPMALAYARVLRIQVLEALGDPHALDAALIEERARILAIAARIDDPSLRASFLEVPPWNTLILAKAAERLDGSHGAVKNTELADGFDAV